MTQQTEALRLADALITPYMDVRRLAAAELRRLHEQAERHFLAIKSQEHMIEYLKAEIDTLREEAHENARIIGGSAERELRLRAINAQLLKALEDCVEDSQAAVDQYVLSYGENFRPHRLKGLREIVAKARAAIAAAKGEA